ncbi:monothiol glutaredoxin-5 [Suillus paluster]|uniref:monothiol glutaredoxin-5 n=1 Tax=Suillus paluster TaxID=48578 RepID=UPI001B87E99C|nr:monothiol glutaredoxin-5 [Suillus paluster]KAG1740506.1 monothiol glutaredoxin-5 [Suillus paluster]
MFQSALRSSLSLHRSAVSSSLRTQTFRRFLSQESRAKIQAAVTEYPVVLFMKGNPKQPMCGFSRGVVKILSAFDIPPEKFKTYNILEDLELRSGIKEFSDWPTIPQLYVNGEFVGGSDITLSMFQSGELETLLEQHGIIPKESELPSS